MIIFIQLDFNSYHPVDQLPIVSLGLVFQKGIQDMKPRLANIEEFVKILNSINWQT